MLEPGVVRVIWSYFFLITGAAAGCRSSVWLCRCSLTVTLSWEAVCAGVFSAVSRGLSQFTRTSPDVGSTGLWDISIDHTPLSTSLPSLISSLGVHKSFVSCVFCVCALCIYYVCLQPLWVIIPPPCKPPLSLHELLTQRKRDGGVDHWCGFICICALVWICRQNGKTKVEQGKSTAHAM